MSSVYAVILAGGQGSRLGAETPKQLMPLAGRPVIAWSLDLFSSADCVDGIIVVSHADTRGSVELLLGDRAFRKVIAVVDGGETRQGSVWNALVSRSFEDDDVVLLHDAARPFASDAVAVRCIDEARRHGAAGTYVKAVDTIAATEGGFVSSIPPRDSLYLAQTPQAFRYGFIRRAHERARANGMFDATDDAGLALDAGYMVKVVQGDYRNIKITTAFDLETARIIAGKIRNG
jgi:2-C-methyl-D-erythritol 4-phosphate cytidylyltransferase